MVSKFLITAGFVSVFGSALAQDTTFYSDGRPEKLFYPVSGLDNRDMKFLKTAQASNEFEIESSQIALTNSNSDFVKQFAKEMIGDHGAAKNEVEQVSTQKSFGFSSSLPPVLENKLNKLRSLRGDAFDNAYKMAQKAGHESAINLFKGEIAHGHDQDVKAVAVKQLPTIELHYKMLLSGKTMSGDTATTHGL